MPSPAPRPAHRGIDVADTVADPGETGQLT
jgi:hypothetical protein